MKAPRTMAIGFAAAVLASALVAAPASAATGPYMVRNINTSGSSNPNWLTNFNGVLAFTAKGGAKGMELWRSDGTEPGTRRIRDIRPGSKGSSPMYLTTVGSLLFFSANDGVHGHELWVSDGTNAGTRLVKDINPGSAASSPGPFVSVNGMVFFGAENGVSGEDLWVSDGSTAGTRRVRDLVPAQPNAFISDLAALGNRVYFEVYDPNTNSGTLYRSNGTKKGTVPHRSRSGNLIRGELGLLTTVGGYLFFGYDGDLWRTTGSVSSTRRISTVEVCCSPIVGAAGRAFFEDGNALWSSDGTAAGTKQLAPLRFDYMVPMGDEVIVFEHDAQPWISNGSVAGTHPVGKIVETDREPGAMDGIVYFSGYAAEEEVSASFSPAPTGNLWRTDGTAGGTQSLDGPTGYLGGFTAVNGTLFFTVVTDPFGNNAEGEIWAYVP